MHLTIVPDPYCGDATRKVCAQSAIHVSASWVVKMSFEDFKGIVAQDFEFFGTNQIDLKFLYFGKMFFRFLNFYFMSNFLIFVSQHSELTLRVKLGN
jgi:hypothetical protein